MKNTKTKIVKTLKKITAFIKTYKLLRRALSCLLIFALISVPILTVNAATNKHSAGDSEQASAPLGADSIFQSCAFGCGQVQADLENGAIDDVLTLYNLPPSERSRVIAHARTEIRSMLFVRIHNLIKKQTPTAAEQAALNTFAERIKGRRVLAAQKALDEYNKWRLHACDPYVPPPPFTYYPGTGCARVFSPYNPTGPKSPSFEEFQQFGAAIAYADLITPEAQGITAKTARDIGVVTGLVSSFVVGGAIGATIGFSITFGTLSAVLPYAGLTFSIAGGIATPVFPAAASASGAIGASAVGVPFAIIAVAVTLFVIQLISVINETQLPGKLQEAVNSAQNQTINLRDLSATDAGNQEIYGAFILTTLPEFDSTDVPAPDPQDRQFVISQQGSTGTINRNSISYKDFNGDCHTSRLSGAWFVDGVNSVENQTLSLEYLNWESQPRIASRKNGQFFVSRPDDLKKTQLAESIEFIGCDGINRIAKIKFDQLTFLTRDIIPISDTGFNITPDPGTDFVVGTVSGAGEPASSLIVTVNGGASTTVNGMTVRNLTIDNNYRISGNVLFTNAPTPTTADFTFKVRNSVGQEQSKIITIKKTAIVDTMKTTLPSNINVGENYSAAIETSTVVGAYSYTMEVTSGSLPLGLSIQRIQSLRFVIQGTPISGGEYNFTISKTYNNGERISQPYKIFVKSSVANLPSGAVSWWRAESNAEDVTGRANGTLVGSVNFEEGKATRAFKFNGTNGYVALPDDTFSPTLDFTFETWFKTATRGVILGRQRSVAPYENPQYGATPAIYVDQNGKLRVQMFQDQNNQFTTSANRVDDNAVSSRRRNL